MKRKLVIEEFDHRAPKREGATGVWQTFLAMLQDPREHNEFYPLSEKKSFFEDGKTYRTVAFSNGLLFGGCLHHGCVETCLPILEFAPDDGYYSRLFRSYVKVHDSAVKCGDLAIASEYRELIEETRFDACVSCRALPVSEKELPRAVARDGAAGETDD